MCTVNAELHSCGFYRHSDNLLREVRGTIIEALITDPGRAGDLPDYSPWRVLHF